MLDHIRIDGYKSIRHLDMPMRPINILIGANGVGKSNFISFFKLVNTIYEQKLHNFTMKNNAERLLFYGRKNTSEIRGYLQFSDNAYSFTLQYRIDGSMFLAEESSWYKGKAVPILNHEESFIRDSTSYRDKWLKRYLESYKIYHFHDTSTMSTLRSNAKVNDVLSLKTDGSNLAAMLFLLQERYTKELKRIELAVQSVTTCFERFILRPSPFDTSQIRLIWREKNKPEKYFDINDLSDGSLRFIALATLLMQPVLPNIIIVDEPELGLHPVAINKLADMVKSAAARGCQIIMASQSVDFISNFDPEEVITIDRKDGQSVFKRLQKKELKSWLKDYSLGELWVRGLIDGQPL